MPPGSTALLLSLLISAFAFQDRTGRFDEITVNRINVVDSAGRTRVVLAGGFPPRREALAGVLFVNEDGAEAGGLVYQGTRDANGRIQAGAVLTFDQYRNDQIVALEYQHDGDRKRQGLTIQERPDTLSDLVKERTGRSRRRRQRQRAILSCGIIGYGFRGRTSYHAACSSAETRRARRWSRCPIPPARHGSGCRSTVLDSRVSSSWTRRARSSGPLRREVCRRGDVVPASRAAWQNRRGARSP